MVRSRLWCRMVVRLSRRRTIVSRRRFCRSIVGNRLRRWMIVRLRLIHWPIVRSRLRRWVIIRLRLIRRWPIVFNWPVVRSRLRFRSIIRLRHRMIVPRRRFNRTIRRSWLIRLWTVRLRVHRHRCWMIFRLVRCCWRRSYRFRRRYYPHPRCCGNRRGRSHLRQFPPSHRLSRMLCQHLLPRRERWRRRRRRRLREHLTTGNCCRRRRCVTCCVCMRTQYSLRSRSHSCSRHNRGMLKLSRPHRNRNPRNRLRAGE